MQNRCWENCKNLRDYFAALYRQGGNQRCIATWGRLSHQASL